jgi:hypothetical protein
MTMKAARPILEYQRDQPSNPATSAADSFTSETRKNRK